MRRLIAVACIAVLTGCGDRAPEENRRPPLTERQRDSVLAETGLPGARVVGKALAVSDSAAARAARSLPDAQ